MYNGEKVRLREYRKEDIPLAQAFMNDMEVRRNLWPGIPFPMTLKDEEQWFEKNSALCDAYNFAIETLDEGKYIGGCGLVQVDWKNRKTTVGIMIGEKSFWGKGYGTDAMKVLIRFIFEQMNLDKIKLNVYSFNERAIKCYQKCGFKTEGVLRKELFRDGAYYDEILMAILREDYEKSNQ